ncbi:MAG: CHAT domain-containing protein [Cyanobacteria bacterium J06631_12]
MSNFQTVSAGMLTLVPFACALPSTAVASPIQVATPSDPNGSGTEIIVSPEQHTTHIQGGIQVEQNLFHRFDSFNVGAGHTANFVTAEPTAAVIGQISGGTRSHIDGTLQISGSEADLYLINPAGVLFGPDAHLNLGGSFTATTASQVGFGDAWLAVENTGSDSGDYSAFDQRPTAYRFEAVAGVVVNQADLAVAGGEAIRFLAGGVANTGTLSAPGGEVTLSAVAGDSLIRLNAEGALLSVEVDSDAVADSHFSERALPELLTGPSADAPDATDLRVNGDGSVTLLSRDSEPDTAAGHVFSGGWLDTSASNTGETGGQINLLGASVTVEDARLTADGAAGGGLIRVGGDYQGQGSVPTAERIFFEGEASADALTSGDGGQVILWSEGTTQFSGLLSAQGAGEGQGGLVETSGVAQLVVDARSQVTTAAPSGDFGSWLLDPVDLSIVAAGGTATFPGGTNTPATASTVDAATLVSALDSSNITLQATHSVTVDAPVDASGNTTGGDLFFQTPTLNLNEGIVLRAGSSLSGQPTTVNVGPNGWLQNAVDAVATGGSVNLAAANYQRAETVINRDVTLLGQGAGSTLLSGGSLHRVLRIDGGTANIDGVTIQDGAAERGGGVLVQNTGSLFLTNSQVIDNAAQSPGAMTGGGLHLAGTGLSFIRDTRFEGNVANEGGAISQNNTHDVLIEDSEFVNNQALLDGGAIDNQTTNSGLTIRDSLFSGNGALQAGGAITVNDALFITDSRLENNSAAEAGAISLSGFSGSTIATTTLDGNQATSDGGAIGLVDRHTLDLERSTLSNNFANGSGGAISSALSADSNLYIVNSTISGNQSTTAGGGLSISPGRDISLTNVTITDNQSGSGGGLSIAAGSSVTMGSSIVAGNRAPTDNDITGTILSNGHNIVRERGTSAGYVATDLPTGTAPLLGLLRDNGGPTWTHALQLNSPAHDRGVGIGQDQRGVNASGLRDIGAYERIAPNRFVFTSGDGQSAVVDTAYADVVAVQVQDALGGALDGVDVTFSTNGSTAGADVFFDASAIQTTDANGTAAIGIRANTVAGNVNVRASTPSLPREFVRVSNVADVPAQLTVTGGSNQSTVVNTAFADPISVEVSDRFGNIVQGVRVDFSVPAVGPSGTLSDPFHITGTSGEGHTDVTANTVAGDFAVLAEVGALSTTVALRNLADSAQRLFITGLLPAAITAGDSTDFTITARDQFGNVATGYTGTVDFESSDLQAQLPAPTVLTGGSRTFSAEARTAGTHFLTIADAVDPTLSVTQNGIVVVPADPSELTVVSGDNQQTVVDTGFADGVVLQVRDRFGNPVVGEPVTFLVPAAGPSAVLAAATVETDNLGQATTVLSANNQVGIYIVEATTAGLRQVVGLTNTAPTSIPPASTLEVSPPDLLPEDEDGVERNGRLGLFDEVAFAQLEDSLTEEYARYWQRPLQKSTDISAVQQILQQAEETHRARSGIVYAVFVPPSESGGTDDSRYSAALSRRLLSNEVTEARDELLLLFIPPEGDPVQQLVPVSRQQIQRLATFFNLEVSSFLDDGYKPLARELYDWLLGPIEDDIQKANIDDLMYVMDEGLSAVPLPAMMTGDTFAIERYGFSVLPSVGLLQTDFGAAPAEQSLLAGGADTFSELEALPAVPVELEIIESIATSAEVLLNEDFEIENLRTAQAIAPKTMMHVATHAAFNPGSLDRSYIQFWDEQLTLDGLGDLGLDGLELLILSACTTAAGSREAELGFAGLAAVTGVEASIGSLWQISDVGTMALMAEFYEQLQADPLRFSALRKAQLSLLRGDTRIEDNLLITQGSETAIPSELVSQGEASFSHPFFWSGFTLVGNPWW